jgi:predicted RNase H-like nuclease (RuvC/YqgF family)
MNFITDNLIPIFSTLFGGGFSLAYLFERKKNQAITKGVEADAETKEIDNSSKIITQYKDALEDLPARYEQKYQEMERLWEKKVQMLLDEIQNLENSYQRKSKLLEDEIKLKNKFIISLKREVREKEVENKLLKKQLQDAENNGIT